MDSSGQSSGQGNLNESKDSVLTIPHKTTDPYEDYIYKIGIVTKRNLTL